MTIVVRRLEPAEDSRGCTSNFDQSTGLVQVRRTALPIAEKWPLTPSKRSTPPASSQPASCTRPIRTSAREQLRVRGLLATRLSELPASGEDSARTAFKKVKPKSLQIFSRQFATMIEAGLNVVGALVILEQQTDDVYLAAVIRELRADVEGGMLLSQAMARHPKVFNRLYVSMVEAGEAAGILDIVLDRVAFQIEKEAAIKRRVKGAMIYPTMVLIFATLVLVGMLLFLVPIFVRIFDQLDGELPTLTQVGARRRRTSSRRPGSSSSRARSSASSG